MDKYYQRLELDKVLSQLSSFAYSEKCKENLLNLVPMKRLSDINEQIGYTRDAFNLSVKYGTPRFSKIVDVKNTVKRANSGSRLSLRELLDVGKVLRQTAVLQDWFSQCSSIKTTMSPIFAELYANKPLEQKISLSIISDEELLDEASPELSRIRKSITRKGMSIRDHLDKLVKGQTTSKYLQDSLITMRDGRYVVPVKAEYKGEINGLVHDSSSSGATLFIEPMSVVEANNEIRILKGKEQQEIERIIDEMSQMVGDFAEAIIVDFDTLIKLEEIFAKASFGEKTDAIIPEITDKPMIVLNKARHPLIDKKFVVPISLSIGDENNCLIITGPNTGGKTVALKTAGLLTLMAMCGMMIPAGEESKIGVFSHILVDIGDEQSIEQSLSTFSSHMTNIISIMQIADEKSLVLVDELGSGTDPVEGSALAVAILQKLRERDCKVLATTHYQEVKIFALETDGVINASCEFDVNTLKPTYKLIVGIPGKSNAFAITKRLGMPESVIALADSLVNEQEKQFEQIIDKLDKARQETEQVKAQLQTERREAAKIREELEKELSLLEIEKEKAIANARNQAMSIIEEVRFRSNALLNELEELKKEKDKSTFGSKINSANSKANSELKKLFDTANPVSVRKTENYKLPRQLIVGDSVVLMDIDKKGSVLKLPDKNGNLLVQVGIMKTKTNVKNLKLVEEKKQEKEKGKVTKKVTSAMERKSSMEIDIRGMNADEGVMEVDRFIDNSLMSGISLITIIHGKGTGILRSAVQDFLRTHPSIKSYRAGVYGEGEAGVTVVELKS